jgi:hypothetical protein
MARPAMNLVMGIVLVATLCPGCVSVDTPDAKVQVGITSVNVPHSPPDPDAAPYAHSLKKVSERQGKVARQISKRDWEDVVKRSSEWIDDIRELSAYAPSTHDPRRFQACCDQLLASVQTLRQSAMRQDAPRIQQSFDACDPPLTALIRNFPMTRTGQAAVASPCPAPAPQPQPANRGAANPAARVP